MKKLLAILMVLSVTNLFGQKLKLIEGDLKVLKGVKGVNTEFTYSPMTIGNKGLDEKDYIAEKKKNLNEKEAGRGDKWEKSWVSDRQERFEPNFRELFAKHAAMTATDASSQYTLIFKTTRTEPGWNIGITKYPAFIDGEAWIVETGNPEKVVAKISIRNSPGRSAWGMDWDTGARLEEAYAKAGKEVGAFIKKATK
jgi:hypothetical protein